MRTNRFATHLLVLLLLHITSTAEVNKDGDDETKPLTQDPNSKQCSIFIAPSSLPGNSAGFGVYTNRHIPKGEPILSGPPGTPDGPTVTVVDPGILYERDPRHTQWNKVFGHYWWGRGLPDHAAYEAKEVVDYQITFGALPNHHCLLGSLEMVFPDEMDGTNHSQNPYDDSLSNRFRDPGAGAYSYHTGRIFYSTLDLPPGSEIFLSYGYCNRDDLQNPEESPLWYPEWAHKIPMEQDFHEAARAARTMWQTLLMEHDGDSSHIPNQTPLTFDTAEAEEDSDQAGLGFGYLTQHGRSLLPNTTTALKQAMQEHKEATEKETANTLAAFRGKHDDDSDSGAMDTSQNVAINLARAALTPRTPEWVSEHGVCIEHLIPGPSTLAQAGRGAFAQHTIQEGELVVPVPLLHIMDKSALQLVDHADALSPTGQSQLLTNYCFSHRHSSLMLCPTSNAILINHCSSRSPDTNCKNGPNAKVQWASPSWDPRTEQNLKMTLEEMDPVLDRLLGMEIVALRDIAPGDEVFIDYGPEFEAAWQKHVEQWKPVGGSRDEELYHFSIAEANANVSEPLQHLVSKNLREEADHPYIFTGCLYWPTELDYHEVFEEEDVDFEGMLDEDILERYSDDGNFYRGRYGRQNEGSYWPCSVLGQDNDEDASEITYVVRITQHHAWDGEDLPWDRNELPRFLYNYPRSSIRFFPKPYQSDHFLPNAFRHPIHISDDMFPEHWMNLKTDG